MITFQDFQKLDIRIGKIVEATKVEGTDKLVKLLVDVGETEKRQLVAGIADVYKPEELVGKKIPILVNLEPKEFKGVLSQGMLLAAEGDEVVLLVPDRDVKEGSKVR